MVGVGTDLIEIERIERALARHGEYLVHRLLSPREREGFGGDIPARRLAGRFAAKEAVLKALGTGLRDCRWHDVEVINDPLGRPEVILSGALKGLAREQSVGRILLSITHSRSHALAFAVAERDKGDEQRSRG